MSDNRSQDDSDLPWPIARGDLDDFEALELVRDATGRLSWQNIRPPATDTYREWLPRRAKGSPPSPPPDDVADVGLDDPLAGLFDSEATSRVARQPLQSLDAPTAPALEDSVELSLTHAPASSVDPLPQLPPQTQSVSSVVSAAPSIDSPVGSDDVTPAAWSPSAQSRPAASPAASTPFWPTDAAAPLRLSLANTSIEARRPLRVSLPPAAPQARSRTERLALLGTGALIGAMATMVVGVAWRSDERPASVATAQPSSAPRSVALASSATPAVPEAQLKAAEVPAARPAAVEVTPAPTSPPVQVAAAAPTTRAASPPARRPARASGATAAVTRPAPPAAPIAAPPEVLATIGRFATAYNRMDARATQAVWPTADRQALVTTFTALREQRLTLSRCRGTLNGDTATVVCRGTLRYRPRVGNHDTLIREGDWRFAMLQRADDWVVDGIEAP